MRTCQLSAVAASLLVAGWYSPGSAQPAPRRQPQAGQRANARGGLLDYRGQEGADQLLAAHLRHHHVGDHDVYGALAEALDAVAAVGRSHDGKAPPLEHPPQQGAQRLTVLDEEDRRCRCPEAPRFFSFSRFWPSG